PRTPTRVDPLAGLSQERSGLGRAEKWRRGATAGRLRAAERAHCHCKSGPALPKCPAVCNFFQPSFKLASKQREGSLVRRRYHLPLTPCQRLLASPYVDEVVKDQLRQRFAALDPVALLKAIRDM